MNLKKLLRRKSYDNESKGRTILVNSIPSLSEEVHSNNRKFVKNEIISSHYKWWNFLPVNLFEQFHVIANFFFLLISILYFFGETPINPITTIAPLVVVIGISMAKDAIDDIKRHKADDKFNRNQFMVLTHDLVDNTSSFVQRYSRDIHCGDIVICYNNSSFPCDMLILGSSNSNGKVFITTDNLDGESSIKTTNALAFTQNILSPTLAKIENDQHQNIDIGLERSTITCLNPCEDLKAFEGSLNLPQESIPLALNNVVFRGANLHHTTFMIGVAVYTGIDTKLSLNGKPGFRKFSSSAGTFNAILLAFIGVMFLVTFIVTILHFLWDGMPYGAPWYFFTPVASNWRRVQQYLTLLFIINYLIPISIMVTMELQQLVLALFIDKDVELYDPETNEKAQVNATNLADELGQIEFLFSDKTGTLTQNKMMFRSYSLANDHHVYDVEEEGLFMIRSKNKTSTISDPTKNSSTTPRNVNATDYFSFSEDEEETLEVGLGSSDDLTTQRERKRVYRLSKEAEQFWTNIVLNHSVEAKISVNQDTQEEVITYNAESPDEKALIDAAAKVGITYVGLDESVKTKSSDYNIHLVRFNPGILSKQTSKIITRKFRVDAVIEFNSVRKRMSVLVRDDEGRCIVYTKGAEVTMLDPRRCDKTPSLIKDEIIRKVTEFALTGLRTLVFAMRELDSDTYNSLLKRYKWAQCQLGTERARALEEASAMIEANMSLIGVSAVEDKLQPGVRQCLQSLISAGIQIWVLTGDKEETAVQISQATGHFPPGTTLIRLTNGQSTEEVGRAIYVQQEGMKARLEVKKGRSRFKRLFQKRSTLDVSGLDPEDFDPETSSDSDDDEFEIKKRESSFFSRFNRRFRSAVVDGLRRQRRRNPGGANEPVGLVIDGVTLRYAISPVLREQFLRLCMNVTTVLCCRMTPLQKAAVVRFVSQGLDGVGGGGRPVTAAVGDGGNDVAMLHEASVGIGIFGNEGRQAVRAADYAIPLFRHLRRLILLHGHWNYYRISMTANIFYFKNVAFVAIQIYQMFYDGFSGQSMFDSLLYTLYNLTFTSYAPFVFGIFEQHISANDLLHRPYLYRLMSQSSNLRCWYILLWVLDGWWHGTVIYYICFFVMAGGMNYSDASFSLPGTSLATVDYNMFGNACFIYLVITTTMRIVVMSRTLNLFIILGLFITGFMNLGVMFIYQTLGGTSTYVYLNYTYLGACPAFWLCLPLILVLTLLPDILWRISSDAWWDYQIELSGVKRYREKYKRLAWRNFVNRANPSV
nr:phospholipid translocating ATPase [Hymenolepis microstoma]